MHVKPVILVGGVLKGKKILRNANKMNAHGGTLCLQFMGPPLLQRLAVGGGRLAVGGGWWGLAMHRTDFWDAIFVMENAFLDHLDAFACAQIVAPPSPPTSGHKFGCDIRIRYMIFAFIFQTSSAP